VVVVIGIVSAMLENVAAGQAPTRQGGIPAFQLDPSWPKPFPANWVLGEIVSINMDSRDHVWILHRPKTVKEGEVTGTKLLAPPVVELDADGNVVQAWGGPGVGYSWMEGSTAPPLVGSNAEHGIFVDYKDNVWVTGNGHVVLKFTRAGKFLLQIGQLWRTGGSQDTKLLGNPCDMAVNPRTNEVFVADGYVNHRVVVFDADTGTYKRHWGAYGKRPSDDFPEMYQPDKPLPTQFYAVHCLQIARDGLVYVCDRQRDRLQVFQPDGTFVKEVRIAKETPADRRGSDQPGGTGGSGSVFRVGFSADPEQKYLYVDSSFGKVWILNRSDLEILGSFDGNAGHHFAGADSKGNLYGTGGRTPKRFLFKGVVPSASGR
jgi:hypothetical protein